MLFKGLQESSKGRDNKEQRLARCESRVGNSQVRYNAWKEIDLIILKVFIFRFFMGSLNTPGWDFLVIKRSEVKI